MNQIKKYALTVIAIFVLQGCLSTERFELASDLNKTDENLERLLTEAIIKDNREPKSEISLLAAYAHDAALSSAKSNEMKMALGYYRIAAIGYWRDDNPDTNIKLFNVVDAGETICSSMQTKAPDRDCFVLRFTPILASVEDAINNDDLKVDLTSASEDEIALGRSALQYLGKKATDKVDFKNGSLVNLFNQAQHQQRFLSNHSSLNDYICANLTRTFDLYVQKSSPYRKHFNTLGIEAEFLEENPFYAEYRGFPAASDDSSDKKVKRFVASKVRSCD